MSRAGAFRWLVYDWERNASQCPVCGGWFGVKLDGSLRIHGPRHRRCAGSLAVPATDGEA